MWSILENIFVICLSVVLITFTTFIVVCICGVMKEQTKKGWIDKK